MQMFASPIGLIVALAVCIGGGAIIGISSSGDMGWYATLNQPSWTPPSWLFGPAWTLLYSMMAVAVWLVWRAQESAGQPVTWQPTVVFVVQLVLNFTWTPIFFSMRQMSWALLVIVALLIAITLMMAIFWRHSRLAAALLLPYLCWVTFATTLNAGFVWLN